MQLREEVQLAYPSPFSSPWNVRPGLKEEMRAATCLSQGHILDIMCLGQEAASLHG